MQRREGRRLEGYNILFNCLNQDFQDVNLSESGYPGFEDFQDIKNMNEMKIMKSCSSLNPGYPDSDIFPKSPVHPLIR